MAPSTASFARLRKSKECVIAIPTFEIAGSDPKDRHWKTQAAFAFMIGNDAEVTPDEARSLVRWILAGAE